MAAKIATGIGVALIGFKLGLDLVRATFKLLNNTISSFIGKVRKYSVAVASAEAQASATRAFAAVQAGQISGQSASTVIQSKSKLEIAILSLQTTVTNVFGPSLAKLIDLGSSIVTFIERMLVDIKPITDLAVLFMNYIMDGLMVIIEWMDIGFVSDAKTALSSFLNLNSGVQGLIPTSDLFFSPGTADTAKKQFFDLWKP